MTRSDTHPAAPLLWGRAYAVNTTAEGFSQLFGDVTAQARPMGTRPSYSLNAVTLEFNVCHEQSLDLGSQMAGVPRAWPVPVRSSLGLNGTQTGNASRGVVPRPRARRGPPATRGFHPGANSMSNRAKLATA